MTETAVIRHASLWPALIRFAIAYIAASAVVTAVLMALDVDSNSGVAAAILVAATAAAAQKFVADNGRAFSRGEQWRLAVLATLALIPISVLQLAVVTLIYIKQDEIPAALTEAQVWLADNAGLVAGIAAFVVALSLAVVYFSAGWLSRSFVKRLPAPATPVAEG
jgi:hypothetical protein